MLHRALAQDDGRGLGEPNNDRSRLEVVVYLLVQPLEPSVRMGRRMALALQHQPRILHAEIKGGAKEWGKKYKHNYFPLASQFPHNIHLLSFKARDALTDDIIFRVLHIYEAGQHAQYSQPKDLEWDRIFAGFSFESKRERSLAMSMDVDFAQARRPRYKSSGVLDHASGISPKFIKQESQNTQEEGVFISQAALDAKKKEQEQNQFAPPGSPPLPGRKLQQVDLSRENKINKITGDELPRNHDDEVPRNDAVVFLEPMQIKSFFVQLIPKRIRTSTVGTVAAEALSGDSDTELVIPRATPPPIIQVSDLEMRAFLMISVLGTGLVILAYVRLKKRNSNNNNNKFLSKRKGLIEV